MTKDITLQETIEKQLKEYDICETELYADDTEKHAGGNTCTEITEKLNTSVVKYENWIKSNKKANSHFTPKITSIMSYELQNLERPLTLKILRACSLGVQDGKKWKKFFASRVSLSIFLVSTVKARHVNDYKLCAKRSPFNCLSVP